MARSSLAVILPCHGREAKLQRALDSLATQTASDFRVYLADDGSTPTLASVARRYSRRLRILYLYGKHFGRPSQPRNRAFSHVTEEWTSFLDSDDSWDPQRIEAVLNELRCGRDVVYHPLRYRNPRRLRERLKTRRWGWTVGEGMGSLQPLEYFSRFGNPIAMSGAIVRTTTLRNIGAFRESLAAHDDFDVWIRLASAGARFHFVRRVLGTYDNGDGRISNSSIRAFHARRQFRTLHAECFSRRQWTCVELRLDYLDAVAQLASKDGPELQPLQPLSFTRSMKHWACLRVRAAFGLY